LVLALLLAAGGATAQTIHEFSLSPSFGVWFGETKYDLDFDEGKSELVFPLDQNLAGLKFGWRAVREGRTEWSGTVRLSTKISDPGGVFTDKDWWKMDDGGLFLFSSTRSNVEGSLIDFEIELNRRIAGGKKVDLDLVLGLGYQKVSQDAVDVVGTQSFFTDSGLVVYEVSYDDLALTYEVKYVRPFVGLAQRIRVSDRMKAAMRAVVAPFIYAEDLDDHVLRSFTSKVDGNGLGFSGRLGLEYEAPRSQRRRPIVGLETELRYAKIEASGRREYYEDNPLEGFDAGEGYPEKRTITTLQYGARLYLGVYF
jgi:outer membrane protease